MEIKARHLGRWKVLDIAGHIKGGDAGRFRSEVHKALAEQNFHLAANLKDVSFIDSSGVGTLITCHQDLKAAGGQLILLNLSDDIYDLFEMTSIDRLFEILDGEETLVFR